MKKILILCIITIIAPLSCGFTAFAQSTASIELSVEIKNGGTAAIIPEVNSPVPSTHELELSDGETGTFYINFSEAGNYSYRIMVIPDERDITFDSTVYSAGITVLEEDGELIADAVLYRDADGGKFETAVFENSDATPTPAPTQPSTALTSAEPSTGASGAKHQPKTGDDTKMELYLLIAMLAAAGIFALSVIYTIDTHHLCKKNKSDLY